MNTKHYFIFSILIFLYAATFCSCSSEDRFVICRVSEYDCDYQHRISGIITVTKGSRRRHYLLTGSGMEETAIKEGEPVAYNPETETAVIKEETDSSIEIFTVDVTNGKTLSSGIELKPERPDISGKPVISVPAVSSGCIQNDGTVVLLVNYERLGVDGPDIVSENNDFLYVYEKGDPEKLKKYAFPQDEPSEGNLGDHFWEEPEYIQCSGKNIYLFSEKNHTNELSIFQKSQPNWIVSLIDPDPEKGEKNIRDIAFIAYDDVWFNYYSEQKNTLYSALHSSETDKAALRITGLDEGYELPEEPVEKGEGNLLFSETPDGKPLIFFVKTRSRLDEQRLELLPL